MVYHINHLTLSVGLALGIIVEGTLAGRDQQPRSTTEQHANDT